LALATIDELSLSNLADSDPAVKLSCTGTPYPLYLAEKDIEAVGT